MSKWGKIFPKQAQKRFLAYHELRGTVFSKRLLKNRSDQRKGLTYTIFLHSELVLKERFSILRRHRQICVKERQHVRHIPSTADKGTYEQRSEVSKRGSCVKIWGKRLSRRNSKCKKNKHLLWTRISVWLEKSGWGEECQRKMSSDWEWEGYRSYRPLEGCRFLLLMKWMLAVCSM